MKSRTIDRVCCVATPYTLLQYLLLVGEEEIDRTYFFFVSTLPLSIRERLSRSHTFCFGHKYRFLKFFFWPYWLLIKRLRFRIWPFLATAEIYGLDNTSISWLVMGGLPYVLLEDGFGTYSPPARKVERGLPGIVHKIERLILRPLSECPWGNSDFCRERILTHEPKAGSHLRLKPYRILDLQKAWNNASDAKRLFILSVFDVKPNLMNEFAGIDAVVFTQPFSEDYVISEAEKIDCYAKIVESLGLRRERILLKIHPAERTDYASFIPGVSICRERIPAEILSFFLSDVKCVVTVSSTSVFSFIGKSQIVWEGSRYSPALKARLGDIPCPLSLQ